MKLSLALALSVFGAAANGAAAKARENKLSAFAVHRMLERPPAFSGDEKCTEFDLTEEQLAQAKAFQRWFVANYLGGDYSKLKEDADIKLDSVLDMMDVFDADLTGYWEEPEIDAAAAASGLNLDFLKTAYANCILQDNWIDEDELLKAVCVGEPHFTTWQGANFDYHGACDLVLIQNHAFSGNKGMDLHVRTEQMEQNGGVYSFVSDAALRIGNDILEVRKDGALFFNKQKVEASQLSKIGGFPMSHKESDKCFDIGTIHKCADAVTVSVLLGNQESITFKVFQGMVHVEVKGHPEEMAMGSVGLMGTYPATRHGRVARDGETYMLDADEFGQEWQVRDNEPQLFVEDRFPQFPLMCTPATQDHVVHQRSLRQGSADEKALSEKAHAACEHAFGDHFAHKNCVFDVMATGEEMNAMIYGAW